MWIALLRLEYLTPVYRLLNVRLLILKKKQKKIQLALVLRV